MDSLFAFRQEVCPEPVGSGPGEGRLTITAVLGPVAGLDCGGKWRPLWPPRGTDSKH